MGFYHISELGYPSAKLFENKNWDFVCILNSLSQSTVTGTRWTIIYTLCLCSFVVKYKEN